VLLGSPIKGRREGEAAATVKLRALPEPLLARFTPPLTTGIPESGSGHSNSSAEWTATNTAEGAFRPEATVPHFAESGPRRALTFRPCEETEVTAVPDPGGLASEPDDDDELSDTK
jgi:hypothetical protein